MQVLESSGRPCVDIVDHDSHGVCAWYLVRGGGVNVVRLDFAPGGRLGRHPAGVSQLFAVVSGVGWVRGGDGRRRAIRAGQGVLWDAGEEHESGAEAEPMVAVVVQAPGLAPSAGPD